MFGSEWLHLAWAQLWQVTTVALAVGLLIRVFARKRSHLAHVLWVVVLLKCITPPLVTSPSGLFCWLQQPQQAFGVSASADPSPPDALALTILEPTASMPDTATDAWQPSPARTVPTDAMLAESQLDARQAMTTGQPRQLGVDALLCCWLVGSLVIAIGTTVRWLLCLRSIRLGGVSRNLPLEAEVRRLSRKLRVRRHVALRVTHGRTGPAVIGVLRPTLLLPQAIVEGRSPRDLEPILAHELLHLRRGDLWVGLLQVLVQSVWWFHPLVWAVNQLLTREAERCCDEEVVAELACNPARYARCLIEVLELKQSLKPVPVFPGVRPVEVTSQRLERIMNLGQGSLKRTPWWCWLAMFAAIAMTLPGAAFVADAKEKKRNKQQLPSSSDATYVVRSYKMGDVVKTTADKYKLDEAPTKQFFLQHLRKAHPNSWTEQTALRWSGKKLVVRQTNAGHRQLAQTLREVRAYGLQQITLELQFVTGPSDWIRSLSSQWIAPQAENPSAVAPQLPPQSSRQLVAGRMSVEKRVPILREVLTESRAKEIAQQIAGNDQANAETMPKIVVFNGQTAAVQDIVQRPFVVGVQNGNAQIRVVSCGMEAHVRPLLKDDNHLSLDYELTHSEIRKVELTKIKSSTGGEPVTLQVPEVATARVDSIVDLAVGKTLLVGGLKLAGEKQDKSMLLLIRASIAVPNEVARVNSAPAMMFGSGVTSDAGLTGQIVLDDRVAPASATTAQIPDDQQLADMVAKFNRLMEAQQYAAAAIVARRAADSFPASPASQAMVGRAKMAKQTQPGKTLPSPYYLQDDVQYFAPGPEFRLAPKPWSPQTRLPVHRGLGAPHASRAVPTDKEILAAIEKQEKMPKGGLALLHERHRNNFRIVKEKVADYHDEPRVYPLVGAAVLHHAHYKCTVYFTETTTVAWPIEHTFSTPVVEEVCLDVTHLRRVGEIEFGLSRPIEVSFKQSPLEDVVETIGKMIGVNIWIDSRALEGEGISDDHPVTIQLEQPVKASSAFQLILAPLKLKYIVEDEVVKITSENAVNVYAQVYNVADLVIPVPEILQLESTKQGLQLKTDEQEKKVDFDSLLELITSTIAPQTWDDVGGRGSIQPFETNLSLVVSHTQDVHEGIGELLTQLRRLRKLQVAVTSQSIRLPLKTYRQIARQFSWDDKRVTRAIAHGKQEKLLAALQSAENVDCAIHPRVTLFNGQGMSIPMRPGEVQRPSNQGRLQVVPVIAQDREHVHLQIQHAVENRDGESDAKASWAQTLADGTTLVLDASDLATSDDSSSERTLWLFTARIVSND